jgi:cysteinyl-tRNA synthetase
VALKLYNTLTRAKEVFEPLDAADVRLYVCGPTVYDFAHIGNARPVIVFDVLYRLLRHLAARGEWDGGKGKSEVTYVRNITDVDDKINERAGQDYPDLPLNEAIRRVTEKTEAQFHADMAALGALDPSVEPRATEHIDQMKAMIERLIENGCAYVAEDHVLFDVASMPDYGKLSGRSLDEMIAGARVEVAPYKRDPMDFVLWKPSKPGEPSWASPAGIAAPGRPGWHIECSAMADRWLWEEARPKLSATGLSRPHMFDIHGGGIDLVFPHHENEIAQSRCAYGTEIMAQIWMHNGFLQVEGEKMAKSAGNFVTVHELLATDKFGGRSWPGSVLRLAMLRTHYRQPIDWTVNALEEAYKELQSWAIALVNTEGMRRALGQRGLGELPGPADEIVAALSDDLNTPSAITELRRLYSNLREQPSASVALMQSCEFLGLLRADRLFAYNTFHVGTGGRLIPFGLRRYLDEIQVAILNEQEERQRALIAGLRGSGVEVKAHADGAIEYEVIGNAINIDERIAARSAARSAKNFKEADRIRDELAAMGITLKDAKDPKTGELTTTWEVAR